MNILLVTGPYVSLSEPYRGGTESSVVDLANSLVKRGHTVDVIAKDTDKRNAFHLIKFRESRHSMQAGAISEGQGQQHYMSFQYGLLDIEQYDVIHYNSYIHEIYEMGSLFNKPSVLTIRLPDYEHLTILYKLFCARTGTIPVNISKVEQTSWQKALGMKTQLIHNGVNLDNWPLRTRQSDGYLFWYGRICLEKNPEAAIHLARHLKRPLKIAGRIFNQDYFDSKIKPLLGGPIEYVGQKSQTGISQLAAGASVFVATAIWQEPFGKTTVEMLASGLPVVGFATAIPTELRQAGISVAIDSQRWEDLVEPVELSTASDSKACRDFATNFSLDKTTDAYLRLYQQITESA